MTSRYAVVPPDADVALRLIHRVGGRPWAKQREIIRAVFDGKHRTTCVQSCTGAGKTTTAAQIMLAWLYSAPGRTVITTAPTDRQVRELLWKEFRMALAEAARRGIRMGGNLKPDACLLRIEEGWMAIGFSSDEEVKFQGWHSSGGTLLVVDEAIGIDAGKWAALKATMSGEHDRILALGNPTTPQGPFYEACREPLKNNVIKISAFETPNVRLGRTVIDGLMTQRLVDDARDEWGTSSPLYIARILGEFPASADDVLVPILHFEAAVERWRAIHAPHPTYSEPITPSITLGIDIARLGVDSTLLAPCISWEKLRVVENLVRFPKSETMETVGRIMMATNEWKASSLRIDADGIGAGVYDRLVELSAPAIEMRAGRRANDPTRFFNARAEWAWTLREMLDPSSPRKIALPPDSRLMFQATSLKWKVRSNGLVQLESKDEFKDRTKRGSPDELDAVALAVASVYGDAQVSMHRTVVMGQRGPYEEGPP